MFPEKSIYLIWFGSQIPFNYELNVIHWAIKNPSFSVYLYLDDNILKYKYKLSSFENIVVRNYKDFYVSQKDNKGSSLNCEYLNMELTMRNGNKAAASDIFRLDLLYFLGGYYFDLDITCQKTISEEYLEYGFRFNIGYGCFNPISFSGVCNDILVANKRSKLLGRVRAHLHDTYGESIKMFETAQKFFDQKIVSTFHRVLWNSGPGMMADSLSMSEAINYSSTLLMISDRLRESVKIQYDNSWLSDGMVFLETRDKALLTASNKIKNWYRQHGKVNKRLVDIGCRRDYH